MLNTYVVNIHAQPHVRPEEDCEDDDVCFEEEIEADRFTALTLHQHVPGATGLVDDELSIPGVRFYIGDEMVAFFDAKLTISVVKELDTEMEMPDGDYIPLED